MAVTQNIGLPTAPSQWPVSGFHVRSRHPLYRCAMRLPLELPTQARPVDFMTLGENSLDIIAVGDTARDTGSKRRLAQLRFLPGGQAATAAVAAARLGWRARYAGCLGDDLAAQRIRAALQQERVEARLAVRPGTQSRMAVVLVDSATAERSVLEYRDDNLRLHNDEVDAAAVEETRVLLVDATDVRASIHAAQRARDAGIPTIVDVDAVGDGLDNLLPLIDVLIASATFPRAYTGAQSIRDGLEQLATHFHHTVAIATLGAEGSIALCGGHVVQTPAIRVDATDTTGAGDAFRAGFAARWLETAPAADLEDLLRHATACAGLNCRAAGAQTALPTRAELAAAM
jgi:sugar/nucleoside kinase (ribokinase family)